MIKFKKLPDNILNKIPALTELIRADKEVVAFYLFGSAASGKLKPLSDLDFAVLLNQKLSKTEILEKNLELIGIISEHLNTDEFDLVILNTAPQRFVHNILKTGKLQFCKNNTFLIDFMEMNNKMYLDFRYFRDQFDEIFLKRISNYG